VPLVVHVETVIDRVTLQVSDESCDIDDGQGAPRCSPVMPGSDVADTTVLVVGNDARAVADPTDTRLLALLHEVADAVAEALSLVDDWGPSGRRAGQYAADLLADDAALAVLRDADVGVLSEESGLENSHREFLVVVDPLDGSTNASRGIPWFATSLCVLDEAGPRVALVVDQAPALYGRRGRRWSAVRGAGAWEDDTPIEPSGCRDLSTAIVGVSGLPPRHLGWQQFRAQGASALDLCQVASGVLDGFVDCSPSAHGIWDYAGAVLICTEAGAVIADGVGRELIVRDHTTRRTPVAAATPALLAELLAARATWS
jgi:fructose-1,6-bisphosphatase/inositol monophosphatase family enzyme